MGYTKGEWEAKYRQVTASGHGIIANLPLPTRDGVFEFEANAHLIASAPKLYEALKADEVGLWTVTNAIKREIASREWILEGRGSYEWDDNRYKDETRLAFEAVLKLIEQVQHPAQRRFLTALAKAEGK